MKKEVIFKLYEDRIDFVNTLLEEELLTTIPLSDIIQVRYEDDFSRGLRFLHTARIYLYLDSKNGNYLKLKNGKKIIDVVSFKNREQSIIDILKTFKAKNIEIFVSTKYQRLLRELDLKNWIEPE